MENCQQKLRQMTQAAMMVRRLGHRVKLQQARRSTIVIKRVLGAVDPCHLRHALEALFG